MTSKTCPDWLRFRTFASPGAVVQALDALYDGTGFRVQAGNHDRGKDGFRYGCPLLLQGAALGRMDWGGESQRGWLRVNLTGQGCEWVKDWRAASELEALPSAEIRRLDLALTTYSGEVDHDRLLAAHAAGRFTCGGRPPNMRVIDNTDPTKGRTCYVGDRKGDKMLRGYEKGREMALRFPHGSLVAVDGHRIEDIYRVEVELKADTRPIPWDAVWGSDQYFAGAYPFCADLLPDIEPDILARRPERSAQLGLRAVLENVRVQYGRAIFTAMVAYDGDITAVWDRIVGDELHPELVAAGVLLVEHE